MSLVLLQELVLGLWIAVTAKGSKLGMGISSSFVGSCDWTTQRLRGDSVPKCALECNEKYHPRHILKIELARGGDQNNVYMESIC